MNAELLYEALNDSHSLEELNEQELGRLVSTYPYFSIGQLLLAKKLKQDKNSESYQKQREHLHAFYRNPWWLYYQLELTDHYATPPYVSQKPYRYELPHPSAPFESIAQAAAPHLGAGTPLPFEETEHLEERTPERLQHPEREAPAPEEPVETPAGPEVPAPSEPAETPPPPEMPTPSVPEAPTPSAPEVPILEPHRQNFTPWPGMEEEEEMEIPTLMGATPYDSDHVAGDHPVEAAQPTREEEPYLPYMLTSALAEMPVEEVRVEAPKLAMEVEAPPLATEVEAPKIEVSEVDAPPLATEVEVPKVDAPEAVAPPVDPLDDEDPDATDAPPGVIQEISSGLPSAFPTGEPAPFPFSVTPLAHDFTFEPLHTVDYFASQGIKLNLDEHPNDNLARHLKSFTEWLRAMKRVSPMDNLRGELDAATEAEIQQLASSANYQREAIVTESMAHVWVLQGKIHKAVEVYNKLSLQHPEKRAYFAAKIEQLNRL